MVEDRPGACRLSPRADLGLVPPDKVDKILYPLQDQPLIIKPCVRKSKFLYLGTSQPAKCTKSIVSSNENQFVSRSPCNLEYAGAVVERNIGPHAIFGAKHISATVEPYHYRDFGPSRQYSRARNVDVQ